MPATAPRRRVLLPLLPMMVVVCLSWFNASILPSDLSQGNTFTTYRIHSVKADPHLTRDTIAGSNGGHLSDLLFTWIRFEKRISKMQTSMLTVLIHPFIYLPFIFLRIELNGRWEIISQLVVRFASRRRWGGQADASALAYFCLEYTP